MSSITTSTQQSNTPLRGYARAAGILYLLIIVSGIFAELFVRTSLKVPGDALATANNVAANEMLFRLGIAGDLVMIISDVALALVFFVLLRPVSFTLSLLAAFFRLTQAIMLGMNLLNLFFVLQLVHGTEPLTALAAEQVLMYFNAHGIVYSLALIFFSVSCGLLGYLIYRSGYFPRILGILLIIVGVGYLTDGFALVLLPNYATYQPLLNGVVIPVVFVGELVMCLWLLVKGVREQPQEERSELSTASAERAGI